MQKILLILCAVLLGVMIASETIIQDDVHGYIPKENTVIDGRDYRTGFPEDCTNYLPEELNTPATKPNYPNIWQGPGSSMAPSFDENPAAILLWGDDILVDPGPLGDQPISADRGGSSDTVFAGVIKHGTGIDSVKVFRSTNEGATWSLVRVGYGSDQTYSNLTLRYARGAQNWIFIFFVITDAVNNGDVWGRRISVDGSSATWFHPTPINDPDTITWVTATRDFNNNYGLNVFYLDRYPDNTVKRTRSTDYGNTWGDLGNNQNVATTPHIDYGEDGYLYVCTKNNERNDIYVGRSTNYGASGSWSSWAFITNDSNEHSEAMPRVAVTHDTGATGMAWVTYNYYNGSDWDSRYAYTTDGGSSWHSDNVLASGSGDQGGTDIECAGFGSNFTRAVFLNDVYGAYKLDYRSNSGANPTSWSSPITLSDTFVFGGMMPKITNYGGAGGGNSGLAAFPGPTQRGLWIDYWGNPSVTEKSLVKTPSTKNLKILPNPLTNSALIYYNLAKESKIEFSAYNTNGERVSLIDNGFKSAGEHSIRWQVDNLPNGVYFLALNANGTRIAMHKVTLMK